MSLASVALCSIRRLRLRLMSAASAGTFSTTRQLIAGAAGTPEPCLITRASQAQTALRTLASAPPSSATTAADHSALIASRPTKAPSFHSAPTPTNAACAAPRSNASNNSYRHTTRASAFIIRTLPSAVLARAAATRCAGFAPIFQSRASSASG